MLASATATMTQLFHNPVTQKLSSIIHSDTTKKITGAAHVAFGMLAVALKSHYIGIALLLVGVAIFVIKKPMISKLFLFTFPFMMRANPPTTETEKAPSSPTRSSMPSEDSVPVTKVAENEDQQIQATQSPIPVTDDHDFSETVATPAPSPMRTESTPVVLSPANQDKTDETKAKSHHRHHVKVRKETPRPASSSSGEKSTAGTEVKPSSTRKKHRETGEKSHSHVKIQTKKGSKESLPQPPGLVVEAAAVAQTDQPKAVAAPKSTQTAVSETPKIEKTGKKSSLSRFFSFSPKNKPVVSTPGIDVPHQEIKSGKEDKKQLSKSHSEIRPKSDHEEHKKSKAH